MDYKKYPGLRVEERGFLLYAKKPRPLGRGDSFDAVGQYCVELLRLTERKRS